MAIANAEKPVQSMPICRGSGLKGAERTAPSPLVAASRMLGHRILAKMERCLRHSQVALQVV